MLHKNAIWIARYTDDLGDPVNAKRSSPMARTTRRCERKVLTETFQRRSFENNLQRSNQMSTKEESCSAAHGHRTPSLFQLSHRTRERGQYLCRCPLLLFIVGLSLTSVKILRALG